MKDTYSTIPKKYKPTTALADRKNVLRYLNNNRNKYKTAKEISINVGLKYKNNSVAVRKIITELLHFHQIPIIANSKGFKLTKKKEEVEEYLESLKNRNKGLQRRINDIDRILLSTKPDLQRWWQNRKK